MLRDLIINHEGIRLKPYKCTSGKLTIGCGRNLDDMGISRDEAIILLNNDILRVEIECSKLPWFATLNHARQSVIICMVFNMGMTRLLEFKNMISYIEKKDYWMAAVEMTNSIWASQVGRRSNELAVIMRRGSF